MNNTLIVEKSRKYSKLVKMAILLSLITIIYNIAEGLVSIFFGLKDETLVLFGFGADSFVEVISGLGIFHMIIRMKNGTVEQRDGFERTALRITGFSFYLLTAGLVLGAALNLIGGNKPETTFAGIIISAISILTMYFLMRSKLNVGKQLNSDAIIADANCTKTCFYLSFILLISSLSYEILKVSYLDIAGSIGIAVFAFREGKESFEKSKSEKLSCSCKNESN